MKRSIAFLTLLLISMGTMSAQHEKNYSPPLNAPEQNKLYWGDLHVHSNFSPDAFAFGNATLSSDDALSFAAGARVTASNGLDVQLRRPLDFLLVADHAEFIGVFPKLLERDADFLKTDLGSRWRAKLDASDNLGDIVTEWVSLLQDPEYQQELTASFRQDVWKEAAAAPERHNKPGVFTAFVGYEWTSMIDGNNLHRVVLFRDDAEKATKLPPYSALDSRDPEDLWNALASYEEQTGGNVMAIPHNGNISNGYMFALTTVEGKPYDKAYAQARSRWEPLYEVTQVKGDSEAHPFLSPDDEFADFETWDDDNIARTMAKENTMLRHEYARPALQLGLQLENSLDVNPYEFGMIGSTDAHTSLATADDNNYWGKFLDSEPSAERMGNKMGGILWSNWKLAASGYAAVWAKENTREALYDALQRKEVYATTGPRIKLRFFGGWNFEDEDSKASDFAAIGYAEGVPMGGRLKPREGDGPPTFLVHALKDPDGANLDRVQIIKGWLNADGSTAERVYHVALSNHRKVDPKTGKVGDLRSTVDLKSATYSNSVGAVSFSTMWEDPDFDPQQQAFYYARVIEIPTPRWTAYDASYYKLTLSDEVPMVTRERVYSSPIWYKTSTSQ
ncbi:MAG: hypothetical protein ACI9JM_002828 [Halioglobus sp.]|jgi:hypothetical protein